MLSPLNRGVEGKSEVSEDAVGRSNLQAWRKTSPISKNDNDDRVISTYLLYTRKLSAYSSKHVKDSKIVIFLQWLKVICAFTTLTYTRF